MTLKLKGLSKMIRFIPLRITNLETNLREIKLLITEKMSFDVCNVMYFRHLQKLSIKGHRLCCSSILRIILTCKELKEFYFIEGMFFSNILSLIMSTFYQNMLMFVFLADFCPFHYYGLFDNDVSIGSSFLNGVDNLEITSVISPRADKKFRFEKLNGKYLKTIQKLSKEDRIHLWTTDDWKS